ncbi:hypothetical protein [Planctomycetes bacterium K23_9]|uniref:Uncharacterized protein n=1 Tax=Stieleria marina TaxID=1930275 RepID=A0A517P087_9BACT|nr:hypothetical protein K239x_47940 [Planctomycetes bacterium K23_9]
MDESDKVDLSANKRLAKFSIAELVLLQLACAVVLFLDFRLAGRAAFSFFALPLGITTWVACRLRYFPSVKMINPFSVGVATSTTSTLIGAWGSPIPIAESATSYLVFNLVCGAAMGLMLGWVAVMLADQIMTRVHRSNQRD